MKMATRYGPALRMLLLGICTVGLMVACGGGGGSSTSGSGTTDGGGSDAPQTTLSGTVSDAATGAGIAGATVQIGTNDSNVGVSVVTDSNGDYTLSVTTSTLNTETTIVVTVSKPGYATQVIEYTGLSSAGGVISDTSTTLTRATDNEFYPTDGVALTRLGDGQANDDTVNSKLQVGTVALATTKTINLGTPVADQLAENVTLTVSTTMRGVQAEICADTITISQGTFSKTWTNGGADDLSNSANDGTLTGYNFDVPTSSLSAGTSVTVTIASGACSGAVAPDYVDDFEFVNVHGVFHN